jgi:A/G-specific adenine glycosylase
MPDAAVLTEPAARVKRFQRKLLAWYRRNQRPLPWRQTRDPYKILVSEIMLQQTQVDRVIPKYHQFLDKYPTLQALAKARTPQLKKAWYPLGYNVRPLRLRKIAQIVAKRHGGQLPDSYDGLIALEGIGRYTAGAVLSFAFGQDAAILDTNVARLLQRWFGVQGAAAKGPARRQLWDLAAAVIPPGNAYDINQAMMDFGAMVCTARKPQCPSCALRAGCQTIQVNASEAHGRPIQAAAAGRDRGH